MATVSRTLITLDTDRCKGCGLCVAFCPENILNLDEKHHNVKGYHPVYISDSSACKGCCDCAQICPDSVFTMISKTR
jgi:2-oxoglutarate ferredoxin oxidoreductase subunit delta